MALAGVHWQAVSYIESGKFPFSVTMFARLSHFLRVSPNRLLDGLKPPDEKHLTRVMRSLARKQRSAKQN